MARIWFYCNRCGHPFLAGSGRDYHESGCRPMPNTGPQMFFSETQAAKYFAGEAEMDLAERGVLDAVAPKVEVEQCEVCGLWTASKADCPSGGIVGPYCENDDGEATYDRVCTFCHDRLAGCPVFVGVVESENEWGVYSANASDVDPVAISGDQPECPGKPLSLRLNEVGHSPTGFAWGYAGSGPAQLAFVLLAETAGSMLARGIYMEFKNSVVCKLDPLRDWGMKSADIIKWICAIGNERALVAAQLQGREDTNAG
ncbi:MAG: hypothetical protein KAW17_09640 [Candidatus Eisenbacteria sp.]|nr:hypothetical protein [Candidatus Eisenbacteria bacterium]